MTDCITPGLAAEVGLGNRALCWCHLAGEAGEGGGGEPTVCAGEDGGGGDGAGDGAGAGGGNGAGDGAGVGAGAGGGGGGAVGPPSERALPISLSSESSTTSLFRTSSARLISVPFSASKRRTRILTGPFFLPLPTRSISAHSRRVATQPTWPPSRSIRHWAWTHSA